MLLLFYLQDKEQHNPCEHEEQSRVASVHAGSRTLLMMLPGCFPHGCSGNKVSQMKNRYSSIAERALFHYGNYCNHEEWGGVGGGASLAITQAAKRTHLGDANSATICGLSLQIIKSIHRVGSHYPIERNPQINLHIETLFEPLGGRRTRSAPLLNHHPPSCR